INNLGRETPATVVLGNAMVFSFLIILQHILQMIHRSPARPGEDSTSVFPGVFTAPGLSERLIAGQV
ncbi:MAG: hypothetical protein LBC62_06425, partial [Treponema sp.]|nr:hypothetical protein [Treponema sp.]